MCLESSNKLKINSVVLIRNIANETKREPLKLERIEEIKESRDDAQRVVVVTYHNVGINIKGEWIGTPVTVERSVNDLVLVDDALDESMLNPELQNREIRENIDNQVSGTDEVISSENQVSVISTEKQEMQRIVTNNEKTEDENDIVIENNETKDEPRIEVRRSHKKRNQRINVQPDEIGDCDDENDEDYK